ncbi:MAG: hypothetical protein FWD54_03030 [Endomicrobia bacterium]|nr:hypothetical protein [Endomicrobiia bacterium]MCL2799238.1 hypothetical protein [Endomicrobiia bacterium]
MKKILFICFALIFAASGLQAVSLIPKIGVDIPSTMDYEYGPDQETRLGFNAALEVRGEISDYFSWGAGVEYNLPRGLVDISGDTDFSFVPVYVSIMFTPLKTWGKGDAKPYFKASVGYSIFATNDIGDNASGGLYYGGGVGTEYKNFVMEVTGSRYAGKFDNPDTINLNYMKIGISLGYKFDLSKKSESEFQPEPGVQPQSEPKVEPEFNPEAYEILN